MCNDISVTRRFRTLPGAFSLCRKRASDAMPNVEHGRNMMAFIHSANNSVDVRLLSKKEVPKSLVFRNDRAAKGKSLQTIKCIGETIEPSQRVLGSIRFDVDVDCFHVPQGAGGQPNEVFHGRGGTFPELHAPAACDPSLRPQALAVFLQRHRLAPRCRASADRLRHPARPLPLSR